MTNSQKQAIITLLEKKGKDRTRIQNWRPISLLNMDYKIATKVIAYRIKNVLPSIIHHSQTGYVKNRYIGESIRIIEDLMNYTKVQDIPGILLFVDFRKAFDSIEWPYLMKCLHHFNFGKDLCKWVKTFYDKSSSCIINNGFTSGYFNLHRGVRQGDPLSPYLFILGMELLSVAIRHDDTIDGIDVLGRTVKLAQYADDMNTFVSSEASAKRFFIVLEQFSRISGLEVNREKTQGMWLGNLRHSKKEILGIAWPTDPIKGLGVYFSYDHDQREQQNFKGKLKELEDILNIWKCRNLSLTGKTLIIKTLGISKFTNLALISTVPDWVSKDIKRLIFNFLWGGNADKVKRDIVYQNYDLGGLRMLNVDMYFQALRASWIPRYFSDIDADWKVFFNMSLKQENINIFLFSNYDEKDKTLNSGNFYTNAIVTWKLARNEFEKNIPKQNQCVWYNKEITVNKQPIFYKAFANCGLWHIIDMFDKNRKFLRFSSLCDRGLKQTDYLRWHSLVAMVAQYRNTFDSNIDVLNQNVCSENRIK